MVRRKRVKLTADPSLVSANTSGFSCLPAELLLEIVSWLPEMPTASGTQLKVNAQSDPEVIRIFRALSKTCRRLRGFSLPLAWKHVAVELPTLRRSVISTQLPMELVAIRTEIISPLVRSMTVRVRGFCPAKLWPEFLYSLSFLKNPISLRLSAGYGVVSENASEYQLSSVRQLNVGLAAIPIAWSCPNLQQLTIGAAPEGTRLSPMANSTRNLRSLMCNFLEKKFMEDLLLIVDDLPPLLEELGIIPREDMASIDTIVRLARHPSMRRIHFRAFDDPILSDEQAEQREAATKRLQQAARKASAAMSAKVGVYVTLRSNGINRSTRFFEFVSEGWKNVPQLKMLEYR